MPSKDGLRLNVTFPSQALRDMVKRDADLYERSESSQVIWALKQYYAEMQKQAELFTQPKLREAKRGEAPIFDTPIDRQSLERASGPHAAPGRGKS